MGTQKRTCIRAYNVQPERKNNDFRRVKGTITTNRRTRRSC